jgi:hypothetical protein
MTPISIRRAFDRDLDRVLHEMAEDDANPSNEGFVSMLVSAIVMGCIFGFVMWLEPFSAWVSKVVGL